MCKRLKVKLKTQRPSNPKQAPEAIEDYQKKYPKLIEEYEQEDLYFQDEMRVGLRIELKRVWAGPQHRPEGPMKINYEYFYLYAAIDPFTGHLFALFLPNMKRVTFEIFIEYFQQAYH